MKFSEFSERDVVTQRLGDGSSFCVVYKDRDLAIAVRVVRIFDPRQWRIGGLRIRGIPEDVSPRDLVTNLDTKNEYVVSHVLGDSAVGLRTVLITPATVHFFQRVNNPQ